MVKWNKKKEGALDEIHFYGIEKNIKQNLTKDSTVKTTLSTRSF